MNLLWQLLFDDSGATAVEYAVMMALILVTCLVAIATLGTNTMDLWSDNERGLQQAFQHMP